MSLLPMLFSNWWEDLDRPHCLQSQHFGLPLSSDDLPTYIDPYDTDIFVLRPHRRRQRYLPYSAHSSPGASVVKADKNKFHVTLDVQQFAPEEVSVKVVGRNVVVEGKHEEKRDEHGWISRQFVRKYLVPEQCDIDELTSSLSPEGVLTITAPRKETDLKQKNERIIQIQNTGRPAIREELQLPNKEQELPVQKKPTSKRGKEHIVKAA